ncbi:hypothetical protein ACTMP8_24665, partial [Escherichia coli]|uniref:hypothetical protein n=1 Tax=Escherichia coli TaxID=562 RepID=UPI003F8B150D
MTQRDRTEELMVIFTLKDPTDSVEVIHGADMVKFQPRIGSIAPLETLDILIGRMQALALETTFTEGRRTISMTT